MAEKSTNGKAEAADLTPRLKTRYLEEIRPSLVSEMKYGNVMQAPRIEKIVINIGIGEASSNSKALDAAAGDLQTTSRPGKPIVPEDQESRSRSFACVRAWTSA